MPLAHPPITRTPQSQTCTLLSLHAASHSIISYCRWSCSSSWSPIYIESVAPSFVLQSIGAIRLFVNCVVPTHGAIATMLSIINGSCLIYFSVILYVTHSIWVCLLTTRSISSLTRISCLVNLSTPTGLRCVVSVSVIIVSIVIANYY